MATEAASKANCQSASPSSDSLLTGTEQGLELPEPWMHKALRTSAGVDTDRLAH